MNSHLQSGLRRVLPFEAKLVRRNVQSPRANRISIVKDALHFRHSHPSMRSVGPVCGVSVVRDEADILPETLDHLVRQGIDSFVIADHGSVDGTAEVLGDYAETLPLAVFSYNSRAFYQAEVLTALSQVARKRGAEWVVPFDADEFWFARSRILAQELKHSSVPVRRAQVFNVYPSQEQQTLEHVRGQIDPVAHRMQKVAFKTTRFVHVADGGHTVDRRGNQLAAGNLFVAHCPWRNFEQFRRKARESSAALAATDHEAQIGYHWRYLATLTDEDLAVVWGEILAGYVDRPIEWAPTGGLVEVDLASAMNWEGVLPFTQQEQ